MSISFTRYVDITSGVIGSTAIRARQLVPRIFTSNALVPTNSFAEFTDAADVGSYFGTSSPEYARAAFIFAFLSKTVTKAQKVSFASWVQTATKPFATGSAKATANLAAFQAITTGSMTLTLGQSTHTLTGLNFSGATSLANVATILQTAIVAAAAADPDWLTATVVYNAPTANFTITGARTATNVTGQIPIGITPVASPTVDAGVSFGLENVEAVFSYGSPVMSLTDTLQASSAASNNYASFAFIPTLDEAQILEVATWLSTQNVDYINMQAVTAANASQVSSDLFALAGNALTLSPLPTEFPELMPGIIMAATDYTRRNASQNYMYQTAALTPSVQSDDDADAYDALRVNYYGSTQVSGQIISFYQRGVLTGGLTSPTDMNVYANEIWFKSDAAVALFNLLLAVNEIPTNPTGRTMVTSTLQTSIAKALNNGTISPGQTLNNDQQQVILQMTGDPRAYLQIQTIGYWLDVEFQSIVTVDQRTEWQAVYTLIYTKNNAVRSVVGTNALV